MTAMNAPRDKYYAVWIIFFIMGLGTLLPWNFFMTATMYFTARLKDPSAVLPANQTANATSAGADSRNVLEAKFDNVMTLCAMLPLLVFTCLNSFLYQRVSQKLRVFGSLVVILVIFLVTAVFVKVDMAPLPFFTITMIKIVFINSFGAILQGSLFGIAGMLPASYTTPIMSGQGLAGAFAAFAMICALASGSALQDSAFGYFITACVVVLLAIVSYLALPRLEFFQYYTDGVGSRPSDDDGKMETLKIVESPSEKAPANLLDDEAPPTVSMLHIFKQIWVIALSVCFVFTVTIGVFPAMTVAVKSTVANGGAWDVYFIPVACFLLFNVMDWAGRSLTGVCMWPGKDSFWLPVLVAMRLVFVPLFMLCNVQPRHFLPVLFSHDAWYIIIMIFFSFSNGYLSSLCMCLGPKKVAPHEAETAGAIMAFFLTLGLALGAGLSFAFQAMV
ncbi:equilibrative nucleoside transporter 1-like [Brachionichthys hirsutus]|uniref:equilibrative nucleoside transporter 1-like n=1 Tax=Brachionichthys hirsutus TaxID=412623 RepID=UPI0036054366